MTANITAPKARKPNASTNDPKDAEAPRATAPAKTKSINQPRETKTGRVVKLLGCKNGATIDQIVEATGWQSHTAHAALTGLKKKGHTIECEETERGSRSRITASA